MLVSERVSVEHFARQDDGSWQLRGYSRPDDVLILAAVDVELPLAEIYERVTFPG